MMRIIVSLTSYPPRINGVYEVIKSLYEQTIQADKIILYLSLEEFTAAEAQLPDNLKSLIGVNGFEVVWVPENLRSHKKYYYALQQYREDIVITVDDDTLYAKTMIQDLLESYQRFPQAVSARKTRIMLRAGDKMERYCNWDEHTDEYAGMQRMDLCAIGVGGILYPPARIQNTLFHQESLRMAAFNQDDLWLKYNEILCSIPVAYAKPTGIDSTISHSQESRLSKYNYTTGNDICVNEMMSLLRNDRTYRAWFHGLMQKEDYVIQKKEYYRRVYKASFDRADVDSIYLCGAGQIAKSYVRILTDLRLKEIISAVIVSDTGVNPPTFEGIQVKGFGEINLNERTGIVFAVSKSNKEEIQSMLQGYAYKCIELDMRKLQRYYRNI